MKRLNYYLWGALVAVIWLLWMSPGVQAQDWKRKKADQYYEMIDYARAIPLYESIRDKEPEDYRRLARAYDVMGDKAKAAYWYEQLIKGKRYKPEDLYRLAYYLRMLGKYDESNKWMREYAALRPEDSRVVRYIRNPDYYKELLKANRGVKLKNVRVNSPNSDFGPTFYGDSAVVFASSRGFGKVWGGNEQPYLDLYISHVAGDDDLEGVRKFLSKVNSKYHDGPATFNRRGDYMVVTRNIYGEKDLKDNKLWLYESWKDTDGNWSDPVPLPFNDKSYSCGHGALSEDGMRLYFVSDMPGGMGGTDLYVVEKEGDRWGKPRNLGPLVNTEGNEMFPFYDERGGYLFFSSDGLPGLGGLDIFVVKVGPHGELSEPVNLGAPVNGSYDDFSLTYRNDKENGFMASNRPGGKGDDDIYGFKGLNWFKQKARLYYLAGKVYDKDTGEPLAATIEVYDHSKLYKTLHTGPDGEYKVLIKPSGLYTLKVEKDEYRPAEEMVRIEDLSDTLLRRDIPMEKLAGAKWKEICSHAIAPIYYDLDKYYIRPVDYERLDSIVALMKRYPEMRILIESHTDSRASYAYNMRLSKNRAISAKKYLVSKGIEPSRIEIKWYGETRPVNECVDGVKCPEWKHQQNRRSEFTILNCKEAKQ